MECKLLRLAEQNVTGSELIDTLWNVNSFIFRKTDRYSRELIDTLWNVNVIFCSANLNKLKN